MFDRSEFRSGQLPVVALAAGVMMVLWRAHIGGAQPRWKPASLPVLPGSTPAVKHGHCVLDMLEQLVTLGRDRALLLL